MVIRLLHGGSFMPASMAVALALHLAGALILQFVPESRKPASQMEIVLASFRHDTPPERADFIAQENQLGSGTEEQKRLLTTTDRAPFPHNLAQPMPLAAQLPQHRRQDRSPEVTERPLPGLDSSKATKELQQDTAESPVPPQRARISQQIASLEAKLDSQRQLYARQPRVRRITSLSTRSAVDARYQFTWQQLVEEVGNANYPAEARQRQLEGDVRLLVALRADGSIQRIELLGSSGYRELDQAAIRSVRLAAPFQPFPAELRADTDILEIVRTWQFRRNRLTSS